MHSHSTTKGVPVCAIASNSNDWDLRNIAKVNPKMTEKQPSLDSLRFSQKHNLMYTFLNVVDVYLFYYFILFHILTSRDRPKSAPYLRLKNTKRTSKCQSIGELETLLWKIFSKKSLTMPKKTKRGDHLGFLKIHSVQKYQKNEGGTLL